MIRNVAQLVVVCVLLGAACTREAAAPPTPPPTLPAATPEPTPIPEPEGPPPEVRGVWVHLFDDTLKTRGGIDRMLDDARDAGMNTVIAQVIRRHDAYYASDVLPRTTDPALEVDLDVLAHLVDGAHERDLSIHAWFSVAPTYHHAYDALPRPAGWVWSTHGPTAPEGARWVSASHDGRWGEYLDPGVPAVVAHVAGVVAELASRYEIDAVHIDYPRYDGARWGYHPVALARFWEETGRSDIPAPTDAQWSDWRRAQTRALMEAVRAAVDGTGRPVGVSAAVIAQGEGPHGGKPFEDTIAYSEKFQDWPAWVRDGIVDAAFPMVYFRDSSHAAFFDQWTAFSATLPGIVAPGLGAWLNTLDGSLRQLALAVGGTSGAVVYSYQQNASGDPRDALMAHLGREIWDEPAPPPSLVDR